jgi:glutamate dehydrogenase
MAVNEEVRKSDLIDRLSQDATGRVPPEMREAASDFVRHYFEFVAPDDVLYTSPDTLLGGALSLWKFGAERKIGQAKVRVFNPSADDGWSSEHTVIEIVNDDMPFLVDSVAAAIMRNERSIHLLVHPVIGVRRSLDGRLMPLPDEGESPSDGDSVLLTESYMHIEFDQESSPEEIEAIRRNVEAVLEQVRVVVDDWHPMKRKLEECLAMLDAPEMQFLSPYAIQEAREFLLWLADHHFLFLGYREYNFATTDEGDFLEIDQESGLGILRAVRQESVDRSRTPFTREFSDFAQRHEPIIITKANSRSQVHKPATMDRVSVKTFDDKGRFVTEHRFLGLFTSVAYSRSVRDIPLVRQKTQRVIERSGLAPSSHNGKALIEILETFPRDEMFQVTENELFNMAIGILQLQDRQRVGMFCRKDVFERFVSCLVFVPRDRYDVEFRDKASRILENAFDGTVINVHAHLTDSPLARAQFIIRTTPGQIPQVDTRRIEAMLAEASRNWSDRLLDALDNAMGEEASLEVYHRYRRAFPAAYSERFEPRIAVGDIEKIEAVAETGVLAIELYQREGARPHELRCKIFHAGIVALSDLMPRLESMGLKVQSETPFDVYPVGTPTGVRIRDLRLLVQHDGIHFLEAKPKFEETFLRVWKGDAENDGFNRLVLAAGMEWHEVAVLRAYCKYLRQAGITLSETYMQQTMSNNPEIARMLLDLYYALFDTRNADEARADELRGQIGEALESVSNPDEDRILRRYRNLIDSTLRTNYFQRDANGERKPWISFKFDSAAVEGLPLPRPQIEVFVYSPRMEGIHLRGGKVARGGLRWSDRKEDFRTEILGLLKAQTVKNAVIVPVGAKGGFIVKNPGTTRDEIMSEGVACYKMLIRALLDLTDNRSEDDIIPPQGIVRRDGDDPYLVVAADKGTATFSDIANGISLEYGFWLGDAFASGGSAGYDHKKMGITARGGWEAVKRHFSELGVDCQREDFTAVGVGDMSGDVFGNAMLLSRHTKLIGAFNHMHIFVDPDPDPERSFIERERLFNLPRSAWSDYDPSVLSAGGAVFERRSKSITVSDRVKEVFDLPQNTVTPNDLIQAILRARADLMWMGGIGTYVKASHEANADVLDRANDPLRVNADELRVRVVGEGANLGFTQHARVEFALTSSTGKINTDAIDNSAGVDCSDHEVNIKILIDDAIARGEIPPEERLGLLAEMTEEVARLVLRDNYQQTQVISVAFTQGESILDTQMRFIRYLERTGKLDRALEGLPDDEALQERQLAHLGLTRPELAVLLAYSKIWLYQELLESDLPDDPLLVEDLILYFPKQLRENYRKAIERHRLRREIIATFVTNTMVNRVRPTFVARMMEETGRTAPDIARAYAIIRDSFDLRTTWKAIEHLDNKVPAALQIQMLIEVGQLLERTTVWLLRSGYDDLDIAACIERFGPRIGDLARNLEKILPPAALTAMLQRENENLQLGLPPDLARRRATSEILTSALDIVRLAHVGNLNVVDAGRVYFHIGSRFDLDRMREAAQAIKTDSGWQKQAVAGAIDDLFAYQSTLTARVLEATDDASPETVEIWLATRGPLVARIEQLLTEIRSATLIDLPMITVVTRQLRALVES